MHATRLPLGIWCAELPASIVAALLLFPEIAAMPGDPLFSGLIAGIVGGLVVGMLSRLPLSVSGPETSLTTIVLAANERLPSFEAFPPAIALAGLMRIKLGLTRSGVLTEVVPFSVITGISRRSCAFPLQQAAFRPFALPSRGGGVRSADLKGQRVCKPGSVPPPSLDAAAG